MKKILSLTFGLVSLVSTAQKTIVEEKFEKGSKTINFKLFPKANILNISTTENKISELSSYNSDGNKKIIIDNTELYGLYVSESEKCIMTYEVSNKSKKYNQKYIVDNQQIDAKDSKTFFSFYNLLYSSIFTSKFEYLLTNKKDFLNTNFYKEDLYLKVRDINTEIISQYKIVKPDINRYTNENFIKLKENLGCKLVINYDETLDLITKSITKDYKKVILYKTRLSDKGEKTKEVEFKLDIPNNYVFIYSNNKAGTYTNGGYNNAFLHFGDDLFINNFIEDTTNGDVYIYGLLGDKAENLNDSNNPKGYYVFKFDKYGNKIWESINPLIDSDFNKEHALQTIFVNLVEFNNKLCLNIKISGLKDFFSSSILSKDSGKLEKTQNFLFNESFSKITEEYEYFGINSAFKSDVSLKKKKYSFETITFLNFDKRILNYIKSVNSKNEINFKTFISLKGIWLTETDYETYYKVTYFNHE